MPTELVAAPTNHLLAGVTRSLGHQWRSRAAPLMRSLFNPAPRRRAPDWPRGGAPPPDGASARAARPRLIGCARFQLGPIEFGEINERERMCDCFARQVFTYLKQTPARCQCAQGSALAQWTPAAAAPTRVVLCAASPHSSWLFCS